MSGLSFFMPEQNQNNDWELLTSLAGGLAHEIRNPLGTIKLNLQLLLEDLNDPETPKDKRVARKLHVLEQEVQRLSHILDDFMRFIKFDQANMADVDINDMMSEIAEFIEPELARQKIELREQYAENLPHCSGDPKLLKQAIFNLIINAQQAMPAGGELMLRTLNDGGSPAAEITDTGAGIPPHLRDKVFDVFFSTKKEGSGLGLALTKKIVDQHRGTIVMQSEHGKGTSFRITLPPAAHSP